MTTTNGGAGERGERLSKNGPDGLTGLVPSEREAASVGGPDRGAGENSTGGRSLGTTKDTILIDAESVEPAKNRGSVRHRDLLQSARALAPEGFKRIGYCGRATEKSSLNRGHDPETLRNSAWVSNMTVCGLSWVCPTCESSHAWKNQDMLKDSIAGWTGLGASHEMALMTLTVRHDVHRPLAETLSVLLKAFNLLIDCRTMRRLKREGAFFGWYRALEITYGKEKGWHPHLHILFFTEDLAALNRAWRTPSNKERERMTPKQAAVLGIKEEWSRLVNKASDDLGVSRRFGAMQQHQDLTEVDSETATQIAGYLTKEGHKWDVAAEMTRSDVKAGRVKSLAPRQLLLAAGSGDLRSLELWREYVMATKGVTRLQGSYYEARTTITEYLHKAKEATEHYEDEVAAGRVKKDPRSKANRHYLKMQAEALAALSFEEQEAHRRRDRELAESEEARETQFKPIASFKATEEFADRRGNITIEEFNRSNHLAGLLESVKGTVGFREADQAIEDYIFENRLPLTLNRVHGYDPKFKERRGDERPDQARTLEMDEYATTLRDSYGLDEEEVARKVAEVYPPLTKRAKRSRPRMDDASPLPTTHPTKFLEEYAERLRRVDNLDEGQIEIEIAKMRPLVRRRTRSSFKAA